MKLNLTVFLYSSPIFTSAAITLRIYEGGDVVVYAPVEGLSILNEKVNTKYKWD